MIALAADAEKDFHFSVYNKSKDRHAIDCILSILYFVDVPATETC